MDKWREYEIRKKKIYQTAASADAYEAAIKALARELHL